ncbi:hypothetical protein [Nocardia gipuzkoensis]|uniref:hypothetical protein n=1 Tax=Nocardia gipuzkoensis TaxID=2749991 RepID=UPI00237E1934|nr:hypothetical protein [Nocardia gipuzkoensis]MDE1673772.1 hypothetical protein [Nocardia gipuzkoensis]
MADQPTLGPPPPRLPGELIVRLVEAYQRHYRHLPLLHADDVLPLLHGGDREYVAAETLLNADRVYYPEGTT